MKKIIVKTTFVAAFVTIAGYGVYANQEKTELSDIMLANVEALANDTEIMNGYASVTLTDGGTENRCKGGRVYE